jgi:dinuclear metal center YbgI/SA1388 family protein
MKLTECIQILEEWAPATLQESYDNSGLQIGDPQGVVSSALITLDCTEAVVEEALDKNCSLIIAHHPLIFGGLKSLTGKNYVERTVLKAVKAGIAIYAIHTNLDNILSGVNKKIAEKLGLRNCRILRPHESRLKKLVYFCPMNAHEKVRQAVFEAGAGTIGKYDNCSFNLQGKGTFKAGDDADPHVGEVGEMHTEKEMRVETVFPAFLQNKVLQALIKAHPYEEVAYDVYALANSWNEVGSGLIGELEESMDFDEFMGTVKQAFQAKGIRYTDKVNEKVRKVALCGGSGSFLLPDAMRQQADVFISGDFKYHQFFDAENKLSILDIGHYESEQFTPELIKEYLDKKMPNFATYLSEKITNPINYY